MYKRLMWNINSSVGKEGISIRLFLTFIVEFWYLASKSLAKVKCGFSFSLSLSLPFFFSLIPSSAIFCYFGINLYNKKLCDYTFQIAYCLKCVYIYIDIDIYKIYIHYKIITFKLFCSFIFFPDLEQFLCLTTRGSQRLKFRYIIMLQMPQFITKWHRDFTIQLLDRCGCRMKT